MNMDLRDIKGKVLQSVSHDSEHIAITFTDGVVVYGNVFGDCCSKSWIEHCDIPEMGGTVVEVDNDYHFGTRVDDPNYECLKVYSHTIKTTKGDIQIEYRNSSNGYYGGWISWNKE